MPNKGFKKDLNVDDLLFTTGNVPKRENELIEKSDSTSTLNLNLLQSEDKYTDILDGIKVSEEKGANTAFYLSKQTIDLINNAAKKKGISRSKIVDEILRRVLGGR